jgi:hypothetical protein
MMNNTIALALSGLMLALVPSCGGGNDNNAKTCPDDGIYDLGCVGDGRAPSTSTPGESPTTSCAKDSYTYFRVQMQATAPTNAIATCTLAINDSSGNFVQQYTLPSGQNGSGLSYGCAPDQTRTLIGILSYSSCCAADKSLTFTFMAYSAGGTPLPEADAGGACTKSLPQEVQIGLYATSYP